MLVGVSSESHDESWISALALDLVSPVQPDLYIMDVGHRNAVFRCRVGDCHWTEGLTLKEGFNVH